MGTAEHLRGGRALVTGGNRGIGLEVVRLLCDFGLDVFLGSRNLDSGAAATASLGLPAITPVRIDVADPASVAEARDSLAPEGIDVLVNNAAIYPRGDVTREEVAQAWQVNALGSWRVTQAFLPHMRERRWGRIVNVSTELASNAHEQRGGGVYPGTKVAMNAMTRALAEDLGGTGILVNACSPGWCRTGMGGKSAPRSAAQGAASVVWGVTLPDDGPTGGFFQDGEPLPW
ncbi:MAG: SDR family NAD(P)-dependent oxidoreductase [Actinomycetota bacterium]|nr:SDR family NAD(P)-dependent oxidoreductase [Actinomycetota bacterium]